MKPTPPVALFALVLGLALAPASGQTQPKPQVDVIFDPQKSAFLGLPLATRKAVQDALVWLGFYNGASDGEFGKRTRDSIAAWQAGQKQAADGFLSPKQIDALQAAAEKARLKAGFETIDDPKTGARVGAPKKLMSGATGAKLEFASSADGDLSALYAKLSADAPTRKVAYKAMKPGVFFVVSGQEGAAKFYTRFERDETATPPIRGFTFSYPAARAGELDRIAIAVANSFAAFPKKPEPAASAQTQQGADANSPAPRATAVIVAPGAALSFLKPEDCQNPSIEGKPASVERTDKATGLVLLAGDFGVERGRLKLGPPSSDLIVLSRSGGQTIATSAALVGDAAKPAIVAGLERSASGAPAFNRQGELAGVVGPIADDPKHVGTVALAASHPIIGVDALRSFLGTEAAAANPNGPPKSAGAIAAEEKAALAAVDCGK